MAKGGFKVSVNGRIVHCHKIEADFDEATIVIDRDPDPQKTPPAEDFDREKFFVSTVTTSDMDD